SFELKTDGNSTYTLTPPGGGWPAGTYSIHVRMLDGTGAEKDQRSGSFTVAGPPASPAASAAPSESHGGEAAKAEFSEPGFSESRQGTVAESFAPDTPKIFMHTEFKGVAAGSKITASWIAEKVRGEAAEAKLLSTDVMVDKAGDNFVDFSMKPNKDWAP